MRQQGQIKDWKDDKGFGFVAPLAAGGEQAFVHINSFLNRQRRPVDGDLISYEAVQDFQQRWQAQSIRYVDELPKDVPAQVTAPQQATKSASSWSSLPLLRVLLILLVLGILGLVGFQVWTRSQLGGASAFAPPQRAQLVMLPTPTGA
jgi:cold shock CspA family protein